MSAFTKIKLFFAASVLAAGLPTLAWAGEPADDDEEIVARADDPAAAEDPDAEDPADDDDDDDDDIDVECADDDDCDAKGTAACEATIAPDAAHGLGASLLTVALVGLSARRRRT